MLDADELPVVRVRRSIRIPASALEKWVENQVSLTNNTRCAGPDVRKGGSTCHTDAKTARSGGSRLGFQIREYIDARREIVKGSTINRELSLLSSAINYARREWEWDIPNPVSGRKPKNGDGRVRWISRAEAAALLREARAVPHLADFVRLALHTGCRKQELLGLEWNRVNLNERLIVLEAEHTKAGKRRFVPLNQTARDALVSRMRFRAKFCPASGWVFARRNGNRIKDVKRSFKSACSRAKIEDFRIHDLRHTCAAWLVSASVPLTEVRDLLGHSTVKMTERYAHLAPDNVRAAVEKLDRSQSGHTDEEEHRGLLA